MAPCLKVNVVGSERETAGRSGLSFERVEKILITGANILDFPGGGTFC